MMRVKNHHLLYGAIALCLLTMLVISCSQKDQKPNPTSPAATDALNVATAWSTTGTDGAVVPEERDPNVYIRDSLKNGRTVGTYSSATLTSDGLQMHGGDGWIRYSIPTTPYGYIEFDASGFEHNEYYGGGEFKSYFITMWSGDDGYDHDTAPYIFELRKYGLIQGRPDASNCFIYTIQSRGKPTEGEYFVMSWDPNVTYHFRMEWGGGETSIWRNGRLVARGRYHPEFEPTNHQVQIGANLENPKRHRRKEGPHDILVSNVVIGKL